MGGQIFAAGQIPVAGQVFVLDQISVDDKFSIADQVGVVVDEAAIAKGLRVHRWYQTANEINQIAVAVDVVVIAQSSSAH